MFIREPVTEYCIASIPDIPQRLLEGFQPYASPFLYHEGNSSKAATICQALVKSAPPLSMARVNNTSGTEFTEVEWECVAGLIADLNYQAIARIVHRHPRTVRNIVSKLRRQWSCQTNVGLVLALQRHSIFKVGDDDTGSLPPSWSSH